jgi:Thiamine pyrophosphate enzyme, C-terminal TPP binding domain
MLIAIMNNHSYNESRARNMLNGGVLYEAGKDFNGYLGDPDVEYTKIAEAYGLKGEKVKNAGDLASALQRCLRSMRGRQSCRPGHRRCNRWDAVEPGNLVSAPLDRGDPKEKTEWLNTEYFRLLPALS